MLFNGTIRHFDYIVQIKLQTTIKSHLLSSSVLSMTSRTTGPAKVQEKYPEMLIFSLVIVLVVRNLDCFPVHPVVSIFCQV